MFFPLSFAAKAAAVLALADIAASIPIEAYTNVQGRAATTNATTVLAPVSNPNIDKVALENVVPTTNVSLIYGVNGTLDQGDMKVSHAMKYPTVVLEDIAAVTAVDCDATSVVVTFANLTVFNAAQTAWAAESPFVLITNHMGDCDAELERGIFLTSTLTFDTTTLEVTFASEKTDVSTTANVTEIAFGHLAGTAIAKRTTINPTYTMDFTAPLADNTVLYQYAPYVTVTADTATVGANVTFSGYFKYNWLLFKVEDLYFDVDTDFSADLALSLDLAASYSTSFAYTAPSLTYSLVSVPGLLTIGPALNFEIGADLSVNAAVDVTTEVGLALTGGSAHLDLLDSASSSTTGWTPEYTASINATGSVEGEVNPYVALTVEVAIDFFSGLVDLSAGLTAQPGLNNTLTLTASGGVDLAGVTGLNSSGTCSEGLELASEFVFDLDAFATQWYSTTLYSVAIPIVDQCYSWA
ncbi:hypothetical protein BP6252_02394 [Coleophoma cylindrospora]|uniref:Isoamyl alcohol oxidase n=1 Tax=Coleophoma cylindrospora TaxID=1849047 RepID=A0A3D8SFA5_9HELO|nr:hypothetical protein BP6252_02394 [Coleophoma cylindrospora]